MSPEQRGPKLKNKDTKGGPEKIRFLILGVLKGEPQKEGGDVGNRQNKRKNGKI